MNWLSYAALSAALAGLVPIFGKVGVSGIDSTLATTVRAAIMFSALFTIVLLGGTVRQVVALEARALVFIVLSGLAGAGSWLCYFRALQLGDALRVAPIDRLSGAVTLVLAALLLHERASVAVWLGTGLMLIGAMIVARS
jgi:bacterial/archaeal transporter family protein